MYFALVEECYTHNKTIKAPKSTCSPFCPTVLNYIAHVFQGMIISPRYSSIWLLLPVSLYGSLAGARVALTSFISTMNLSAPLSLFPCSFPPSPVLVITKASASSPGGLGRVGIRGSTVQAAKTQLSLNCKG